MQHSYRCLCAKHRNREVALLMRKEQIALMQNIDYISCREEQGAQIIGDITGREVPVGLDPTLMVRPADWEKLVNPVSQLRK